MPEDKRRSGSSRSTSKKTPAKRTGSSKGSTAKKATSSKGSTAKKATTKRSTTGKAAAAKRSTASRKTSSAKKPASRGKATTGRDDLQPLDLEGTDFEDLLDASADLDTEDVDDLYDAEADDDGEDDELEEPEVETPRAAPGVIRWNPPEETSESGPPTAGLPPIPPVGPGDAPFHPMPSPEEDEEPVSTRDEALVAILGLLLAGSTLLPWYEVGSRQITGLGSGSFGPLVFVAGIGAAIIAGARLLGKRLRFPMERGLILEVLGYIAAGSVIIKRFLKPAPDVSTDGTNTFIALALAIALALLASRLSSGAPLMVRPGWRKEKGGQAGAGILASLVLVAVALAIVQPGKLSTGGSIQSPNYSSTPPKCSTSVEFPVPAVLKEVQYFNLEYNNEFAGGGTSACGGLAEASQTPKDIAQRFQRLLKQKGWNFDAASNRGGVTLIVLRSPRCGTISASRPGGASGTPMTQVQWNFTECTAVGGTPPN
jgi:hypothetical protein